MTRSEDGRRAVQGAWARAVPLTRRERAAMEAALVMLRDWPAPLPAAFVMTRIAPSLEWLGDAVDDGLDVASDRYVRALFALYLRARLRADRGDCGPRVGECEACGGEGEFWDANVGGLQCWTCDTCDGHGLRGRITPLWERATR